MVARLFSILRLNPPASIAGLTPQDLDLLVATGPGVPGFEPLGWFLGALVLVQFILRAASVEVPAGSRESSLNVAVLTFIRIYVGLMFVPHFGSHILGGPASSISTARRSWSRRVCMMCGLTSGFRRAPLAAPRSASRCSVARALQLAPPAN